MVLFWGNYQRGSVHEQIDSKKEKRKQLQWSKHLNQKFKIEKLKIENKTKNIKKIEIMKTIKNQYNNNMAIQASLDSKGPSVPSHHFRQ